MKIQTHLFSGHVSNNSLKWILAFMFFQFLQLALYAQETPTRGLDDRINDAAMPIAQAWEDLVFTPIPIWGNDVPIVLILLLFGATFFTIYFGFVNVRRFPTAIQVVRGKYDDLENR